MNELRLDKLKKKLECVNKAINETREQLVAKISSNPEEYEKILKNLIIQVKL